MNKIDEFLKNPCAETLSDIKKNEQTAEIIALAIKGGGREPVLKYASKRFLTKELCAEAFAADSRNFEYIPDRFKAKELCMSAVKYRGEALCYVPEEYRTYDLCYAAVVNDKSPEAKASQAVPQKLFSGETGVALYDAAVENNPVAVEHLPPKHYMVPMSLEVPVVDSPGLIPVHREAPAEYQLTKLVENSECPIYYISDIHLEHQIGLVGPVMETEIRRRVRQKVSELVEDLPEEAVILFAGDICHSPWLHRMFQKEINEAMFSAGAHWHSVYVLGNHEIWDGDVYDRCPPRDMSDILKSYERGDEPDYTGPWGDNRIDPHGVDILENSVIVRPANCNVIGQFPMPVRNCWIPLSEKAILKMDVEELQGLCKNTIVILGGTGFAGLNQKFNADAGIYRNKISRDEEISRTMRFNAVYEKLLSCAADLPVIVLTHMPISDWLPGQPNPNWIYVNGHTHQNAISTKPGEAVILADNQVGYKPRRLYFNRFFVSKWADPFKEYPDGIYTITNEQYIEFQHMRGIPSNGCKRMGTLYMVKRGDLYMFFLDGKSLYILNGGQIKKEDHPIEYYYDRIAEYVNRTKQVFVPYRAALAQMSSEIKAFGGSGKVHGSIVDIDYYTHVFLDPFTGIATPYFALNKGMKIAYPSIPALLKYSGRDYTMSSIYSDSLFGTPHPADYSKLLERYKSLASGEKLPAISIIVGDKALVTLTAPGEYNEERMKKASTAMYKPSAIMRALQYLFDNNVVRVWNDAVFNPPVDTKALNPLALPGSDNHKPE
mgnify:CR=1 FL=1